MYKKPIVVTLLLWLVWSSGWAQTLRVQAITVADGLSQGFISCLYEDRRGFIWIGTLNGLNRYDGYRIKRFTPGIPDRWTLKVNFIYCIAEDARGLLWIGTDKGPVVMDPYTERFVHLAEKASALPKGEVCQILTGKDGRVWMCYRQGLESGICVMRPPQDLARLIREDRVSIENFDIHPVRLSEQLAPPLMWLAMLQDSILCAADINDRLCRIDPTTLLAQKTDPRSLPYKRMGQYGLLYTQQNGRGFVFQLHEVPGAQIGRINQLADFIQVPGQVPLVFCSGDSTIYQMDTLAPGLEIPGYGYKSFYRQFGLFTKLDKAVSSAGMVDRSGNFWLGTNGFGVRKVSRRQPDFKRFMPHHSVYNFVALPDGRIWPGAYRFQRVINLNTGQMEPAPWAGMISTRIWLNNLCITRAQDWWMAAVRNDRLVILKKERGSSRWVELPFEPKIQRDVPVQMLEDRRGNVWIAGNMGEVFRIRPAGNQVDTWQIDRYFPAHLAHLVRQMRSTCLVEDKSGNIWLGCNYGLVRLEFADQEPVFRFWHNYTDQGAVFPNDWILSVYPDPTDQHLIWLGARGGGLNCFNSQTGSLKIFTEKDGLSNNVVYGILPDTFGYLWLSTNRGLSRFNPRNQTFANFQNTCQELNTEFNTDAYRVLPTGELAFGSIEGLFLIRPPGNRQTAPPATVEVTHIEINGKALDFSSEDGRLGFKPDNVFVLKLPYEQNNVAFEFAAPQTGEPTQALYRYRVNGLSKHWVSTGTQRSVNLVGLPPGQYVLELQAKEPDAGWDSAPVSRVYLTILPPWYRSWPAYLAYILLFLLLIRLYIQFDRKKLALEHAFALSRKEMEQLKVLDDFKNRFFAYISHEFKTPLTIILGLAGRLNRKNKTSDDSHYPEDIIRQGQIMLELVDHMIDIARLDEQQLQLKWRQGNISHYVRYVIESHRPLADFRDIQLNFQTGAPDLIMDFDPLRLKYILSNLLANAIRHSKSGGTITVCLEPAGTEYLRLEVSDNGEGIAPEDLPFVFKRYFQGQSGNEQAHQYGLGLAFVKDLVKLFKGSIEVSSTPGQGARFTIMLPISRNAPLLEPAPAGSNNVQSTTAAFSGEPTRHTTLPLVLVVEDNPVIAAYLQTCLQSHFHLLFAPDGQNGWLTALEHIPDIILTDVMMPGINGLALTQRIKTHELTSHIPVVMLSARSELADRLSGQQHGADAYLGKPFHEQELILVLQNLYGLQRRWQDRYAALKMPETLEVSPQMMPAQDDDTVRQTDAFMLKLYRMFEDNFTNEAYDLPQLCRDMEISKSQLQRKLAALSDQPAIELLRRFRLQKAYTLLLQHPELNVKEACFRVGFKDPAHFSRMFSKAFGIAPSEVKKTED